MDCIKHVYVTQERTEQVTHTQKDRVVDCIKHVYVRQEGTEQVTREIYEKLLSTKRAILSTTVGQEPQPTSEKLVSGLRSQGATKSQILRELLQIHTV